jgi:ABC-2 type transport system ATP-binding protein
MEPFANPEVYKVLGYCPDIDSFYEYMSGRQFVQLMGRMAGYSQAETVERAEAMLVRVGMADRANRPIAGYSKGMRQRIKLAQAMIHDPKIILLDEPLNGLDPLGRREFIDLLAELAEEGRAIIVSSHILYEVEQMTKSILLLHRGRLLATGDLRVIRGLIDKHPHQIRIETEDPRRAAPLFAAMPNVVSLAFAPGGKVLELQVNDPDSFYDRLADAVLTHNLPLYRFSSPDNNLESVFRYLVGP